MGLTAVFCCDTPFDYLNSGGAAVSNFWQDSSYGDDEILHFAMNKLRLLLKWSCIGIGFSESYKNLADRGSV